MFADIVDFTRLAEELPPRHIIRLLNAVFSEFDRLTEKYGLEKIKTVGDAYMVAGGLTGNSLDYTNAVAQMALEARAYMATHTSLQSRRLELHIGISTGPVVAGVIGVKRFIYDVWGNTVNIASRLASEAMANNVLVDVATYQRLHSQFDFEGPEALAVKGKRQLICYRLEPRPVTQSTVVRPVQLRS
jgi:class 3 adenylate cyclase